jgi:NADPH:quinone reductase-like Zn-dependent oxidoreductase
LHCVINYRNNYQEDHMNAAQIIKYGKDGAVAVKSIPNPTVSPGHVIVKVKAAGVNPADWKVRSGFWSKFIKIPLPFTAGGDFAGVVAEVGSEVTGFQKGDEVYGQASILSGGSGSFAESALVNSINLSRKPKNIDFIQAGALPLVGISALQVLTEHLQLKPGQKILIHGGGGGIGSIAVQIAKHIGAYVATTVSAKDKDLVKNLGADEIIDYNTRKFEEVLSGYDAVFDTVAGETYTRSFAVLKKGGTIVSMNEPPNTELMEKYGVTAIAQQTRISTDLLNKLTKLVENGAIRATIAKTFPLTEAAAALDYQEEKHPSGKIVVVMG